MASTNISEFSNNEHHYPQMNATKILGLISDEAFYYILFVNLWGPGQGMCIFGVVTNILNIITFAKQGVKDTVNISLLGLATSDLGSQITLLYMNLSFCPMFLALDLPFVSSDVMYIVSLCRTVFTRVSACITAYITLERCLCVTMPLKVKHLFTPKRTTVYLVAVYLLMIAGVCPMFCATRPAIIFDPLRNNTLFGLSLLENRDTIDGVTLVINNATLLLTLCLVIICTAVLVSTLQQKSKWRQHITYGSYTAAKSDRDNKVVKTVVLISVVFAVCYCPSAAFLAFMLLNQELRFDGVQKNLLFSVFSIFFFLESVNAGVNIFIYLRMSSKFKTTFMDMFCFKINSDTELRKTER